MSQNDKQLLYFADPMCSWCWGFSPVIARLAENFDDTAPVTIHLGGLRAGNTQIMDNQQRMYILNHWFNVNEASGQPFDFGFKMPEGFVYNTEPACRAVKTVQQIDESQTLDYFSSIQKAFYTENQDVTQTAVLIHLAADHGLPADRFEDAFNSDDIKQLTQNDFMLTQLMRVNGFPCVIGQSGEDHVYITQGFQLYSQIEQTVKRWLEDQN